MRTKLIKLLSLVLRRFGFLTPRDSRLEAERLLEEERWKIEAALEAEKKQIEWERQILEHDRAALTSFAMSIGVPVTEEKPLH